MKKCLLFILILISTVKLYSQGATRNQWLTSKTPNYATNINLAYPYSEQEYSAGNVNLIPEPSSFIDLIDFYGEGRIVVNAMVSGFKSAYNINHEHQRVSNGPDKDRKIPNRIPVKSYNGDLYLSKYVANDKVSTITLMGAPIQKNTAEEMARMIRKDGFGKIIIYGFSSSDAAVTTLETELEKIGFYYVPKYKLTAPFNEITGFSSAPRVYKSKKIKVVGEKVFYSLNPKADLGTVQSDMVTLDYSSLLALNSDLSGGIKGTIDKPGGKITVEVYAHDNNEADGIQKLIHFGSSGTPKIVYSAYSDINSVNQYVEKTIQLPYGFGINSDGSFKVLGEAKSNNIKQLGANTKNGWRVSDCDWAPVRFFYWIGWKVSSLFWNAPNPCQDVVTNIQSGKQPVILKVTIKDATLYDFKIPGVQSDALLNLVDDGKGPEQYKIIKKLKVTILESPNEHKDASFYKDKIGSYIKEANTYYSAKTGNIKNPQITAEVGNPRILFKDVDLIIKKGTRENYNYQIPAEEDAYNAEAKVNENNDETMQLIYVHSLSRYYPANTKNVRVIRGMSNNGHHVIENSDYTVFSYNRMFNDDMAVYGTPGSTVAHEFGHYFNLDHPFEGGCAEMNGGDHVSDTPPAEGALWYLIDDSPNAHGINNPCQNAPSCPGTRRQVENIMDYGPCRWMFTKGQADRMTTRINTKPSLFNVISAHDASVDPNTINIVVDDQRKGELRRKRDEPASDISIRMIYPNSKDGIYNLEVVSDRAEKAKIQIFNNNQIMVYEKDILVEKGSNSFQMEPSIFDRSGLYILFYTAKGRAKQIKILPR